jgi:hypothetical protein
MPSWKHVLGFQFLIIILLRAFKQNSWDDHHVGIYELVATFIDPNYSNHSQTMYGK